MLMVVMILVCSCHHWRVLRKVPPVIDVGLSQYNCLRYSNVTLVTDRQAPLHVKLGMDEAVRNIRYRIVFWRSCVNKQTDADESDTPSATCLRM